MFNQNMPSEDSFLISTVKEEIISENEDEQNQSSSLNHNFKVSTNSLSKNNIEVQVLSYMDIKEEPDSESENYLKDIQESQDNSKNTPNSSYDLFQSSHNKSPKRHHIQLESMQSSKSSSNDLYSDQNLNQIVKIKEEDEFEFKIVELNSLSDSIEDNNQLESTLEFEDEQKTSFRMEDLNSYESQEDHGSIDTNRSQKNGLNHFSRSSQINKTDGNPKLTQQFLNRTKNRSKLEERNLVLQASFQYCSRLPRIDKTDQDSLISSIKQEINDEDQETATNSNHTKFVPTSNSIYTSSNKPPSKQENLLTSPKKFTVNFLQKQILQDSSKIYQKSLKFSELCYQKFANLSNSLQKLSQNEKLLSRILLKNPSTLPPQQKTTKMQIISKSIRLDKTDLSELPKDVMEKFNLNKNSVNFEKKEGQVINMFNIPYYVCTSCFTVFATQNIFFMHYKNLHAIVEKPFDCWKCVTSYCTWKELMTHLKCHEENRPLNCKYCFYSFKFKETLEKHMKTVHVEKFEKISCEICGRNFDNERDMLTHKKRHAGIGKVVKIGDIKSSHAMQRLNSIKCIFCPAQFFKNEALEEHYKTHKSLEKMKCRGCGKDVMVNPQFIINNIKMREFKCIKCTTPMKNDCGSSGACKSVTIANGLVKIEKTPEHQTVIEAPMSKIVTSTKLKADEPKKVTAINMKQESRKLSVKCYVCGIEVSSNVKLFWHMKEHLEKNEFKCSVCLQDFVSRELMVEHSKVAHPTTTKAVCKICNQDFHFVDLDTHMKIHAETSSTKTTSTPPKRIKLNSKGEKASFNEEKTWLYGVKCPTCNEYVLNKNIMVHNQKHDQERTSKLIQNIQNRRKREDFECQIGSSS